MTNADFFFSRGALSQESGNLYEAVEHYKIALSIEPDHSNSKNNLKYISHKITRESYESSTELDLPKFTECIILSIHIDDEFLIPITEYSKNLSKTLKQSSLVKLAIGKIKNRKTTINHIKDIIRYAPGQEISEICFEEAKSLLDHNVSSEDIFELAGLCHPARMDLLSDLLDRLPNQQDARIGFYRGLISEHAGDIATARHHYRAAIRWDPNHTPALHNLSRLTSDREEARACILQLAPTACSTVETRRAIIGRMIWTGLVKEAISLMEAHVDEDPELSAYLRFYQFLFDRVDLGRFQLPISSASKPILASLVVWGRQYIELFLDLALASLLQPGNLPALADDRRMIIEIATDREGAQIFESSPILSELRQICAISYIVLDDSIMTLPRLFQFSPKYLLFGMASHITALRARACGGDVLFLLPDAVYAENSLRAAAERLKRGDVQGILADGLNTNLESMQRLLERHRLEHGTILAVGHDDLTGYALSNLHSRTRCQIFTSADTSSTYPSRFVFGKQNGVSSRAFNIHPVIITNQALQHLTHPNYLTPDGLMVEEIFHPQTGMTPYIFEDSSEFLFVEVSRQDTRLDEHGETNISAQESVLAWLVNYGFGETTLSNFLRATRFITSHPVDIPLADDSTETAFVSSVEAVIRDSGLYDR